MNKPNSKPQALQQRLISHAAVLMQVSATLPHTPQATHVSRQLLRSGTAAAANYGEARGAESRSDFVHKLRIVLKELNETTVWLEIDYREFADFARKDVANCRRKRGIVQNHRGVDKDGWRF